MTVEPVAAIVEQLARFRGSVMVAQILRRRGLPLALAAIDLDDRVALLDLDDPRVLAARGLPGLLVTYRNDTGAPASRDGLYHLGSTEWEDLEAAARYALTHGARWLVLCGYSMGGQIVMQFLSRSRWAASVRAVVLESPVLSWDATFERRAQVLGVPPLMTWLGERVATARAGLDWGALDRVARTPRAGPPILVLHGVKDSFAPEPVSEAFARALPERVTLVRVASGNHVEAWNADPAAYAAALGCWLDAHGIGARGAR